MKYQKTRYVLARVLAVILTLTAVFGLSAPLITQAASNVSVLYRYDGDGTETKNRVRIRSVIINDKKYFDIHDGSVTDRVDPNNQIAFLQAVLQSGNETDGGTDSLIGQWASLAEQIYGTHSKYAAFVNAGGGFAKNFTGEENRTRNGYADVAYALSQKEPKSDRKSGKDNTYWTGLAYAKNLKSVRQQAAEEIASGINRKVSGSSILNSTEGQDAALKQIDDDTTQDVLYSLVTCVDRVGSTPRFCYNTFGLAFYDFKLSVIAGEGLEYITKAQKYDSLKEAVNGQAAGVTYKTNANSNPKLSYYKNESKEEADIGMEFKQSNSLTTSNTLETGKSYSYSEMIGSETTLSGEIPLIAEVEQTLKMEVTCEQALSTAYSETKEYSETSENTISSSMSLPAQTAVGMESSKAVTNVQLGYDCPVAITYKVAVFSLSGTVYDDNMKIQSFSTAGYRQSHFSTIFGSESEKGGTTAMDNLYNRAVRYTATPNYEQAYGQTYGWTKKRSDGNPADKLEKLEWKDILNGTIKEEELTDEKTKVTLNRILVDEDGVIQQTFSSEPSGTEYPIGYESLIEVPSTMTQNTKKYTIYDKTVKDSNGEEVDNDINYNANGDTYNKWIQPIGEEEKKSLAEQGVSQEELDALNSVNFYYTENAPESGTTGQRANSNQKANKAVKQSANTAQRAAAGTNNSLINKVSWLSTHCPMSVTGGVLNYDTVSMNSNIKEIVPLYPLKKISVTNGVKTLNMISGDTFDLSTVTLKGSNKNDVEYYGFDQNKGHWILINQNGKELTGSNIASLTEEKANGEAILTAGDEEGTLYLKYMINDDTTYTSLENEQPATNVGLDATAKIKVNVTAKPFDGSVQAEGTTTIYVGEEPVNLIGNEDIKGYAVDSTDKKISGAPIVWEARLDEEDGIKLENNRVSFTKEGTYQIRATYRGKHSEWISVKALPEKALTTLKISDDTKPATLESFIFKDKGTPDIIDLSKLTVKAFDQYDGEWNDLSDVKWHIDFTGEKAEDSFSDYLVANKLPIDKAGTYKIQARARKGRAVYAESNVLELVVKPTRKLTSLNIETDIEKDGIGIGDSYSSDLKEDVKVTALDQYGDEYDWTKEEYKWLTGGKYSKVTGDTLLGLVKGSDTLQLIVGKDDAKIESNVIDFAIVTKPYVKELYTGDSAVVREGEEYDLTKVNFTAKDQNGEAYILSQKEIDSIQWKLTDKGTIKSTQASFSAAKKTLSVAEGTLSYGETGNVILTGTFTNKNGIEAQAVQFTLTVRQKPVLDTLQLEKKDAESTLKNGENAYVDEYFTVKGLDQYGEEYGLDEVDITWNSDNEKAFRFENNKVIAAVEAGKKANIAVSATNKLNQNVVSNEVELSVPRVRSLQKITLEEVPEAIPFNSTLDLTALKATCYDELGEIYSEEDLKAYPAKVIFSLDANGINCKLDTAKNILQTYDEYGYITISAMAVNSSTTNEMQDENGNTIISSVKIWVGPKVEALKNTEKMIATAGANTITLEGKCLEDNMKAGLFDADGRLITEAGTSGNADSQSATLDIPSNIGGKSDVVYTVKYAIKDTYMDEPTGKITVSNKIPATGVKLNKNNLVIAPKNREVLKAIVSPSNSTDKLSWSSTARRIASVDKNGNVSAAAPGKAVITVTTESGKKASCNVLVGLRQGDVISSGIYRYKVTDSSVDGTGQMEVAGFIKGRRAKNVTFPKSIAWNGIKYNVTSVGTRAFEANKKIKTVIIPDSVEKICHKAFYRCANMKKLTVGKNVSFFGAHAFCNNKKITKIVFKGKKLKTLKDPHVFICVNHAKVYVPKSKYKVYKKLLSTYGLGKCKFVKK